MSDTALYGDLFGDAEVADLFTDAAEIRAMLRVEAALALAQAGLGEISDEDAQTIALAAETVELDPSGLAKATGQNAVPVPVLVTAFRDHLGDAGSVLHLGATSQDIMDTGLALRLRGFLELVEARLNAALTGLADLAEAHADLPMAGRTYGQNATPTSFGAVVASWGWPLVALRDELPVIRAASLKVSLSGAAGTSAALGPKAPDIRAKMAATLDLTDPGHSWHTDRGGIAALAAWLTRLTTALGKMGEDLVILTHSGIAEVLLPGTGSSSTMPQKSNPVQPSLLGTFAREAVGLNTTLQIAPLHREQRDGAAWLAEWRSLPRLAETAGQALLVAQGLTTLAPNPAAMATNIDPDGLGLIYAEALSFELAKTRPRPLAQSIVKELCQAATQSRTHLAELAKRKTGSDFDAIFVPMAQLGLAPAEALAFAAQAR